MLHEQIDQERGTLCWVPNFAMAHLTRKAAREGAEARDLSSLRAMISCSEPVLAHTQEEYCRTFTRFGLRRQALAASYAMAETTFAATQTTLGRPPKVFHVDAEQLRSHGRARVVSPGAGPSTLLVSSGRVLQGTQVDIVDANGASLGEGQVGEIRVRSDSLFEGYWNEPQASAAALVGGWLHTGDLGVMLEDELVVMGRKRDLVIVGGHNVNPHDVEECAHSVAGVVPGRAVAFGVTDDRLGTERLVVLAEVEDGKSAEQLAAIEAGIRERVLAVLAVTVGDVRLFSERTLLKSTSGKLSRARNRELYLKGAKAPA
jgi:acyl-CoA synthetase (AMP-forming)/AMP-acid ligase II